MSGSPGVLHRGTGGGGGLHAQPSDLTMLGTAQEWPRAGGVVWGERLRQVALSHRQGEGEWPGRGLEGIMKGVW